ncbi:MAG: hypothetical protein ACYC99_14725 [Candidatus Geothermincolia bacterium]
MRKNGSRAAAVFAVALMVVFVLVQTFAGMVGTAIAADNPAHPTSPVKLVFIHHSSGENWLADPSSDFAGGLGIMLRDNNYFVSDTNYGWGPPDADLGGTIGDHTYTGSWYNWFRGTHSSEYLAALYGESGQNCSYSRGTDPGGQNTVVMFKSCFPNSALGGGPGDPPTPIASNPLKGSDTTDPNVLTVGNAKGVYVDLLEYFKTRQDRLFVVITAPPLADGTYAANARAFNDWLVSGWLSGYGYNNVFVFDYYNVLTSNGGGDYTNDAGSSEGNHHRWWNNAVQHQVAYGGNTLAYQSSSPDHPNTAGNQKATLEYISLLNVAYNRFKGSTPPPNPPVPPPSQWKSKFYFAEGYTGTNFQEYACLENPNTTAAATWITCMFGDGTSQSQYYSLSPGSRLTVDINQLAGAGKEVSMRVVSTSENVVAERPMYFNYMGKWTGGHDVIGANAPAQDWYFAEGTTIAGFDEYITVLNPDTNTANLTFHYMVEGAGEVTANATVIPGSRATFKAIDHVGAGKNISLRLESNIGIVAERPMYFVYQGLGNHGWTGGHDVIGATAPAGTASFAEGTTRGGFEEWLCIQNPNTAAMNVQATYLLGPGQGAPVNKTYHVAAKQRLTVSVNQAVGPEKDVSVKLTSDDNFIAERPMYFMYHGVWDGGHDVIGTTPHQNVLFAEGYTGTNFEEWLCVQNANAAEAHLTVTYYPEGATEIVKTHTVAANSRYTIDVNKDAGPGLSIAAKVESDQPVLVERPMYFNFQGQWTGGHDVAGYPMP